MRQFGAFKLEAMRQLNMFVLPFSASEWEFLPLLNNPQAFHSCFVISGVLLKLLPHPFKYGVATTRLLGEQITS
ncbi:unnamed protein product [Sphenostylis stenocarpa]|uniref:Uncharacterized protein n=1 Tax=Sphenostylis stenocarpa TaxID=92480 RepID=A0AA86SJD9_9FABA|nr:unnamed protein product [Sphenostylis stenocarpa]